MKAQNIIHYWHFNNAAGVLDVVPADVFSGTVAPVLVYQKIDVGGDDIGVLDDVAGTDLNARGGFAAGNGVRPRNPSANGEIYIGLNAEGYENLQVSYATERSGSGMLEQQIWYTTDGSSYQTFGSPIAVNEGYALVNLDFSAIEAANDNPDFAIKIRFLGQNTAENGNNRIDNLVLEGDFLGGANIIHYWHFNEAVGTLDVVEADFYTGLSAPTLRYQKINPNGDEIGIMDEVEGSVLNARMAMPAGNGIRPRNPSSNAELYITLNSTGFEDLQLSYVAQRSGSGMLEQQLYFTTNGNNFTPFGGPVSIEETYGLVTYDFSGVAAVNNNPNFAVKVRFLGQNDTPNGNNRIDNFVLQGVSLGGPVTGVIMFTDNVLIGVGETSQLDATVLPVTAGNQNINWSSDNSNIATVSNTGLVTGVTAGSAVVSATSADGGFQANAFVTVVNPIQIIVEIVGNGAPIQGAQVTLDGVTQIADVSGSTSFLKTPGTYPVSVTATGFVPLNLSVTTSGDITFIFELTPFPNALIHYWHFNTLAVDAVVEEVPADFSAIANVTPTIVFDFLPGYVEVPGAPVGFMDDFVPGTTLNAQLDEQAGSALRLRNPSEERALLITLPTNGLSHIILSFDVFRSGSGMLNNKFEYTLDGNVWTNALILPASVNISETFETVVVDFTAVEGANDNPNFAVRITYEGNTSLPNGNNRYDNVAMFANMSTSTRNAIRTNTGLIVYPNPSTGMMHVALSQGSFAPVSIYHLYDLSGRRVKSGPLGSTSVIDASGLNPGAFVLVVENGSEVMQKVVVISE